ncbi:carboxylesterase family protein [Streptomyces ambofaciens]|uniref:carboxylesterase family protein n=1 Tax=Streptomyces ambofaciens TaxID=1889 RepID=UPI000D178C8E
MTTNSHPVASSQRRRTAGRAGMSEDCLYLNVYTPAHRTNSRLRLHLNSILAQYTHRDQAQYAGHRRGSGGRGW